MPWKKWILAAMLVMSGFQTAPVARGQGPRIEPGRSGVERTFDPNGPFDNDGFRKHSGTDPGSNDAAGHSVPPAGAQESGVVAGAAPPANDTCQAATVIPGDTVTYNPALLITTGATVSTCDAPETCEAGNVGTSNSVWYTYTPDADGTVVINTFGSTYNTVLSVFTGSCGAFVLGICRAVPTQLACNDDYPFGNTSQITMAVSAGLTYKIKVADYNTTDGGGSLNFNLFWSPANDVCADAIEIPGISYDPPPLSTQNAAVDVCENEESCEINNVGTSNTVWYSYTPPCDGLLSVNTNGSSYDTVLSIWDKCGAFAGVDIPCNFPEAQPVEIACDDDGGTGTNSQLEDIPVSGGQTYLIKAADYNTSNGGGSLNFNLLFEGANPPIAEIASPAPFACVCEDLNVIGTAAADDGLLGWTLEVREASDPAWTLVFSNTITVNDGLLGIWDTGELPQGHYFLRLTVENTCGLTETAVTAVFLDAQLDTLEVRRPLDGDVLAGVTCVDGTVWDRCFSEYAVVYRPAGNGAFTPVDPSHPVYTSPVQNDPLAGPGWDTTGLPDGDYELRVHTTDLCDNLADVTRTVTVDNTPPTAVITSPFPCTHIEGVVEVFGTANDAEFSKWALQYTGGADDHWVTIAGGENPVVDDLLAQWDTSRLPPCAYTLRLLVYSRSIVNCDDPQASEYLVSVDVGELCPVDLNGDGVQDLRDYAEFQNCLEP